MKPFSFEVQAEDPTSAARIGLFHTPHGPVRTPFFMPVGTRGTVKGILPRSLMEVGTQVVLANTFHLHLRPGEGVVRDLGGLHAFMGWNGPILTDSGGYQIFSLQHLTRVTDEGACVKSIVDGTPITLTPESVIRIERDLGADIVMALDECPSNPTDREQVARATERTHGWLARCVRTWRDHGGSDAGQALFGIVQGGAFEDLRIEAVEQTVEHDLPGYAIGGVSVGEHAEAMWLAVESAAPHLPRDKPRYLMGVGTPLDFVDAISRGMDMFDCVTPTRHGRNHQAFTSLGRINLRNVKWARDGEPLDPDCDCPACSGHSRGYLRHLCKSNEMLAGVLLTLHNLRYFHALLEEARSLIPDGGLPRLRERLAAIYG